MTSKPSSPDEDPKPVPPARPAPEECCHSGCTPCVFDIYELELERHRAALAEWEKRRAERPGA